eukprot:TRINITY_DN14424_c0_g1_i2.p5 TRINITY_DN14424_c0_g1~~TRINITY_DN14424_c0_g1_i2.p5  ORF type:complete len:252 (+),score=28.37 TRINITY_DN14424_c0_g1_i2:625-1380(+)
MSDEQNLLDQMPAINALSEDEIVYCDKPIMVFIDEAESVHTRASIDLPLFTKYGFKAETLDLLLAYAGALRTAQSNWEAKSTAKSLAIQDWRKEAPAMYELKEDLIDHMEFAFRNEPELLDKLDEIKKGDSRADAVQDMASLSVLGKENASLLEAISYDITKCDRSAEMADHMGTLLGNINGRMYFEDDLKLTRDKAFTLTKRVFDEVCSFGKFVFRNDPDKARAYASRYNRKRKTEYRKQKEAEAEETAE